MAPKHKPRTATKAVWKCKATAGEKIVGDMIGLHARDIRRCYGATPRIQAARIDRAIARAVKRERLRCMALIANARDATPYTAVHKAAISRVMCSIEEGEQP